MFITCPSPLFPDTIAVTTTSWPADTKLRMHRCVAGCVAGTSNFNADPSETRRQRSMLMICLMAHFGGSDGGEFSLFDRLNLKCWASWLDASLLSGLELNSPGSTLFRAGFYITQIYALGGITTALGAFKRVQKT